MFKLDNYEIFSIFGLDSCIYFLKCITTVLRYHYARCKKTSSVLLYLQQKWKILDKIPDDKIDSHLLALRRVYLFELEENITKNDFKPTTKFHKARKIESETTKPVDQFDEIHEAFKNCYLFSSTFSRKVDVERCI